jgi:hypothetical protein
MHRKIVDVNSGITNIPDVFETEFSGHIATAPPCRDGKFGGLSTAAHDIY